MKYQVHETAIIDDGAEIGESTKIWQWVHICGGAKIGSKVSLGQNVFIGNNVIIGNKCKIQNNVSIYDNVYLEEGVFCGPSMVFTNVYNPRALIERKDKYKDTKFKSEEFFEFIKPSDDYVFQRSSYFWTAETSTDGENVSDYDSSGRCETIERKEYSKLIK